MKHGKSVLWNLINIEECSRFDMKIDYAKTNTIMYFLNEMVEGKKVNEYTVGNKEGLYPIKLPNNENPIIKLYKKDKLSWGGKTFNASHRGGFHVYISLRHNCKFGIYGDDLITYEDENYTLSRVR